VITFFTAFSVLLAPYFSLTDIAILYLLGILVVAIWQGLGPSLLAAICGALAFDFYFVPPTGSLTVYDQHFVVTFGFMIALGAVISTLAAQIRYQAAAARQRERRTAVLYALSRDLAHMWSKRELAETASEHIRQVFECRAAILLPDPPDRMTPHDPDFEFNANERALAEWVYAHGQEAGLGTETLPYGKALYLPLIAARRTIGVLGVQPLQNRSQPVSSEQRHLLEMLAGQTALALERVDLIDESQKAKVQIETERMRNALLSSISHDLKTPLAAITGAAGSLMEDEVGSRLELVQTITEEADRLNRLISDLLDMTRLEAGALLVRKEWHVGESIIGAALARLGSRLFDHPVTTHLPAEMPLVQLDSVLIGQVLMNLLENAIKYTPPGSQIEISVNVREGQALFQVADRGPGIPAGDEERIFDKFYRAQPGGGGVGLGLTICRGIVAAHGGRIWAENRKDGGAAFQFTLPLEGQPPEVQAEIAEDAETPEIAPIEEVEHGRT
jgi:two-component system, OmpR family, sensor histidine kinase KdpD